MNIKHIMSNNLITADINDDLVNIAKKMKEFDIGIIPIKDNNKIIGVLTDRDIVVNIIANKDNKIEGYIKKELITIDVNDSIDKALILMKKHKIKRLLVTKENNIIGIISLSDIINHIDSNEIMNTIKEIFTIYRNSNLYKTSIDDFEL